MLLDNWLTVHLTLLFFGRQVIAVILAVFLHHGHGRAITSTSNGIIERMFDLAEEELHTALNETNENPTEQEENPADVLKLSEPDSLSHEAVQSLFSVDVSGKSANKDSDNVTIPMEANPVWRHKRSLPDEPECYTGDYETKTLKHAGVIAYPVCREVAKFTACSSSMASNNKRKCVPSNHKYYPLDKVRISTKCSCAAWTDSPWLYWTLRQEHRDKNG